MDRTVLAHGSGADDIGLLVIVLVGLVLAFVLAERAARRTRRERQERMRGQ